STEIAFFKLIVIYDSCSQLLEQSPVLLGILGGGEIDAMFVLQFFFGEAKHGAKRWIHEERLPIQVLHHNSNGTGVENIVEQSCVYEGLGGDIGHSWFPGFPSQQS